VGAPAAAARTPTISVRERASIARTTTPLRRGAARREPAQRDGTNRDRDGRDGAPVWSGSVVTDTTVVRQPVHFAARHRPPRYDGGRRWVGWVVAAGRL